jgi:hypothetical protein
MGEITIKQESFCQSIAYKEFDFIWEAYKAHYSTKKMSQNAIYVEACKLMQHPKISLRIKEIEADIVSKSQSTLDEILIAMSKRVRMDIRTFYKGDGSLKQVHEWTEDQAMCVNEWDTKVFKDGETKVIKIKLSDLKGVWDMFMKKFGAYVTKHELTDETLDHLTDLLGEIKE